MLRIKTFHLEKSCGVLCCTEKHSINVFGDVVIVQVREFFEIVKHWEKHVTELCGKECRHEHYCGLHHLFYFADLLNGNIRWRNMHENEVVSHVKIKKSRA